MHSSENVRLYPINMYNYYGSIKKNKSEEVCFTLKKNLDWKFQDLKNMSKVSVVEWEGIEMLTQKPHHHLSVFTSYVHCKSQTQFSSSLGWVLMWPSPHAWGGQDGHLGMLTWTRYSGYCVCSCWRSLADFKESGYQDNDLSNQWQTPSVNIQSFESN